MFNILYEVFGKVYQQNAPNQGQGFDPNQQAGGQGFNQNYNPNAGANKDDNVVDADYEVVDDDKKDEK